MSTFATIAACWVACLLIVWPWFVVAGRTDDAMARYARARGLDND